MESLLIEASLAKGYYRALHQNGLPGPVFPVAYIPSAVVATIERLLFDFVTSGSNPARFGCLCSYSLRGDNEIEVEPH